MKNNIDKQLLEKQMHKTKDKANTVFLKLYAKLNKPKNPFDDARSYTLPSMRENKPGGNLNDPI